MHCRDFEDRLEPWSIDGLDPLDREACNAHLASCPNCAELVALMKISSPEAQPLVASEALPSVETFDLLPPSFLFGVLEATSGSPCRSIEEGLVEAFSESSMAAIPSRTARLGPRVREHLGHCLPCRGLEEALVELRRELPRLATIPVDADFSHSVLRRTLPPRQRFARWSRTVFRRWFARPRFATELAYALTLVLILVVGNPSTPLRALSNASEDLASGRVERELKSAARSVQSTEAWVAVESSLRWADGWWDAGRETARNVWVGGVAFADSLRQALASVGSDEVGAGSGSDASSE